MGNSSGKPVVFSDAANLDHFKLLRVVGKGAFGKVRIVERKDTGLTFALKYIRKDEVVRQENVRNIVRERKMLEHLNHPFLCNLRYGFQDYEYLYLVIDLMSGGDLRFHISRKTFDENAVRFWIAELGCALQYVHQQGIVHRDVKPDNVMLDTEGHVHLADFNVAAEYTNPRKPLTSKSGTLAYLAPEVYEGIPYKSEVDWWSLGVLFYECIYSKRPFDARNHKDLGEKIKQGNPKYPITEPRVDTTCVKAMQRLMCKKVHDRIGASGFDTFTQHPFFLPLDFDALQKKQIPPVFVPSSEKINFDATYDLEELLLEEAPLEARTRNQKPRPKLKEGASDSEKRAAQLHEMLEVYFEPFDYTKATFNRLSTIEGDGIVADQTLNSEAAATLRDLVGDDVRDARSATPGPRSQPASRSNSPHPGPLRNGSVIGESRSNAESSPVADQAQGRQQRSRGSPNNNNVPLHQRPLPIRSHSVGGLKENADPQRIPTHALQRQETQIQNVRKGAVSGDTLMGRERSKSKGVMGFLRNRTGDRGKSPARRYPAGVIGKDGARKVVADG